MLRSNANVPSSKCALALIPLVAASLLLTSDPLRAMTYFVSTDGNNANSGAQNAPWQTISFGMSRLAAGDTLLIRGGTYTGTYGAAQFPATGTSWSSPITIAAYRDCPTCPPETVTLQAWDAASYILNLEAYHRYIILDGLIIDGFVNGGVTAGGLGVNASHIRLKNLEVKNVGGYEMGAGLFVRGDHIEILNCKIHDNGHTPQTIPAHGVYFTASDSIIEGNDFYNNAGNGIQVQDSGPGRGANRNIIRNNRIYGNQHYGGIGAVDGVDNLVYNNLIYRNNGDGIAIYPVGGAPPSSNRNLIYNNTLYNNTGNCILVGMSTWGSSDSNQLINNICFANGAGIQLEPSATNTVNLNNSTSDPLFMSADGNDFHLSPGSPLLARGANLYPQGVTTDFDGIARPQPPIGFDIGAYQSNTGVSSPCDVNENDATDVSDVQFCVNQAIGIALCTTCDINGNGQCNVIDVQRVVNAVLGDPCVAQ